MSIRSRAYFLLAIVGVAILAMAADVYVSIRSTDYYRKRVEWANHQLAAATALMVSANRFSEQIAEFFLVGEPERPDFESARAELEAGFDILERVLIPGRGFPDSDVI